MNKEDAKTETHNPITGELIPEVINPLEASPDDILRDAQSYLGLMETFDIVQGGNMEKNILAEKEKINKSLEILDEIPEVLNTSLINSDELLKDFIMVREALRDDITTTRVLLKKLGEDMASTHADDLSGTIVMAYAELKKGNVASMQMLMDSYGKVAKTQLDVKKLITEIKELEGEPQEEGSVTNIVNFVGTPAEMLASLTGKK